MYRPLNPPKLGDLKLSLSPETKLFLERGIYLPKWDAPKLSFKKNQYSPEFNSTIELSNQT